MGRVLQTSLHHLNGLFWRLNHHIYLHNSVVYQNHISIFCIVWTCWVTDRERDRNNNTVYWKQTVHNTCKRPSKTNMKKWRKDSDKEKKCKQGLLPMKRMTKRRMRTLVNSCRTQIRAMKMINPGGEVHQCIKKSIHLWEKKRVKIYVHAFTKTKPSQRPLCSPTKR